MYDDILVPFDGSDGATSVLYHVGEIATRTDATVHVLYVADTDRDSVSVVRGRAIDALVAEGEDVVDEAAGVLASLGVDHETDVIQGNPVSTIVAYADRTDQDLIAMATHGRSGIARFLAGSVSERVVRLSSVPVLTARMKADERLSFPYEHVVVATDGSDGAARGERHGVSLAATLDATLHAVSIVDDDGLAAGVRAALADAGDEIAEAAVEDLVDDAEAAGVETRRHVGHGTPVEGIVEYVESNDVDAVVMGTTGRRNTDRILLGSVAEQTVRTAPVPVITVGDPDGD
ncbi:universal stress protein [Halobaculum sp. CBA1158]|uniref:universal stress protein n=1 Tax=Halobaculum sp. CBA1158 TaxID=2904243 RepID=UPI001F2E1339|nr:universal stress protein [Halobaculum sp. CBA1158]UIO98656.1 universal stress protein [Halobaculum sp. CBA1158]